MSLIQVSNLTFAYDGSYETIFENVSFQLDTNWKLGFTGRNGRGKTTFLNLLQGKFEYQGSISASVSFSYLTISLLAVLSPRCRVPAFPSSGKRGLLASCGARASHCSGCSCPGERTQACGFSSGSSWA